MQTSNDRYFDKALNTAWLRLLDAIEVAEVQGRRHATARLKYACRVVNEVQADVVATANVRTPRLGGPCSPVRSFSAQDSLHD